MSELDICLLTSRYCLEKFRFPVHVSKWFSKLTSWQHHYILPFCVHIISVFCNFSVSFLVHFVETFTTDLILTYLLVSSLLLSSLGESVEIRSVWALEISNNPRESEPSKPKIRFVAGIHGNAPVGTELLLEFATLLCINYGKNPAITRVSCGVPQEI